MLYNMVCNHHEKDISNLSGFCLLSGLLLNLQRYSMLNTFCLTVICTIDLSYTWCLSDETYQEVGKATSLFIHCFRCHHKYHTVVLTGITVLLALTVFMSIMSSMLPRSSESMPLIISYIFSLLTISVLTVAVSVIIVKLHHMEEVGIGYHQLYLQPPHHCQTAPHGGGGYRLSSVISSASPSLSNCTTWRRWV